MNIDYSYNKANKMYYSSTLFW